MKRDFLRHHQSVLLSCFLTLIIFISTGKNSFAQLPDELHITMVKDSITSDEIAIIFYEEGLAGYDDYDGLKFANPTINLSSLSEEGYEMAINVYSPLTETVTIPLAVSSSTNGSFSLNFSGIASFATLSQLTLHDAYTDSTIDVAVDPEYAFSINNSDASTFGASRFSLTFQIISNIHLRKAIPAFKTSGIKTYPNPCKNELNIQLNEDYRSGAYINITDINGKVLFSSEVNGNQYIETLRPDISFISSGMYFIHIISKDGQSKENIKFTKVN